VTPPHPPPHPTPGAPPAPGPHTRCPLRREANRKPIGIWLFSPSSNVSSVGASASTEALTGRGSVVLHPWTRSVLSSLGSCKASAAAPADADGPLLTGGCARNPSGQHAPTWGHGLQAGGGLASDLPLRLHLQQTGTRGQDHHLPPSPLRALRKVLEAPRGRTSKRRHPESVAAALRFPQ